MLDEFVAFIAKNLVEKPEEVQVESKEDENGIHYTLTVSEEDLGRVIGREGRNVKAIRTLLMSVASRLGKRTTLDIGKSS